MASDGAAIARGLAASAASRGIRPPVRLVGADARAWPILSSGGPARSGDALMLDEYGELWWARANGPFEAQVTRACWPEETGMCADAIHAAAEQILGRAAAVSN